MQYNEFIEQLPNEDLEGKCTKTWPSLPLDFGKVDDFKDIDNSQFSDWMTSFSVTEEDLLAGRTRFRIIASIDWSFPGIEEWGEDAGSVMDILYLVDIEQEHHPVYYWEHEETEFMKVSNSLGSFLKELIPFDIAMLDDH